MNVYLDLFLTFARIGGLTFGGGYAMLPILQREVVESRGWATEDELTDYYAIGQCTPGIIAVNVATFIGNKIKGIPGGIVATLGVVSPSVVIISLIAAFLQSFMDNAILGHAFAGLRVCVCVLVFNTLLKLRKSAVKDAGAAIICLLVLAGAALLDLSPVILVLFAGAAGICYKAVAEHAVPKKGGAH